MTVEFNHTIIHARDSRESADFLADIMGLAPPEPFGPFQVVRTGNGVSLDFIDDPEGKIASRHFAFLVSEKEFDAIFGRIKARGLEFWADPMRRKPGEINRRDGGRGVYFCDPSGHFLEIITRPYGSGAA